MSDRIDALNTLTEAEFEASSAEFVGELGFG